MDIRTDSDFESVKSHLVGQKIVAIERDPDSKESFPMYENAITITLESGLKLHFDGWGYDACGLNFSMELVNGG